MLDTCICRYDSSLKDQLVELLGLMWGDMDLNERRKLFEWIYENNPYTQRPFVYLALHGEHVVAQRAFVIQKFIHNNDEFLVGVPSSAIVHPDFRRQGLFSKLTEYAFEDMLTNSNIRLLLSLSSNEASTPGNIKSGFIPIGRRESMYFFSPVNGLKKILRSDNGPDDVVISNNDDVTIEITRELRDREISNLMQNVTEKDKIRNARDGNFYAWRFAGSPHEYVYAYSSEGDETTSYLSLRKNDNMSCSLMEYGYLDPTYFRDLVNGVSKKILTPSIVAPTFTRSQNELLELKRSGFNYPNDRSIQLLKSLKLIRRSGLPGALVKPMSLESNDNAYFINGVDMRLGENWSLFQSDVW